MSRESAPKPEQAEGKTMRVVEAEAKFKDEVSSCAVIDDPRNLDVTDVVRFATENGARVEDPDDAPDDQYLVQFPGVGQELLTYDGIMGRLREPESG
jgi:hypothetical protein